MNWGASGVFVLLMLLAAWYIPSTVRDTADPRAPYRALLGALWWMTGLVIFALLMVHGQ